MNDLDLRRRRAAYRAAHRGTKEMDWLLGRFADARLAGMVDPALASFEQLLALADPELQDWLMNGTLPRSSQLHGLVEEIRDFHSLTSDAGASRS
jgi:antitoxin CptB